MAKKIKIVELDIDVEALTKKAAKSRKEVSEMREDIKKLKKVQKEAQKEINKSAQNLDKLTKAGLGQTRAAEFLRDKINSANEVIEDSNYILTEHEAKLKSASREYNLNKKVLQAYSDKTLQHLDIIKQTDGSINQISAALSKNKDIYKSLSKEERENAEVGGMLLEIIQQQDEEYKELHKSIGNTQVEVGNYKDAIKQAAKETDFFNNIATSFRTNLAPFIPILNKIKEESVDVADTFRSLVKGTTNMSKAQKTAVVSTNLFSGSLKVLKLALISTGIGLIVVLLGSLVAWFSKSQKGADKLGQIMAQVNAIIDVFVDRFTKLGGILFSVISGQKSLSEAWNEGKEAVSDINIELKKEIELAGKLAKKLQEVKKAEVLLDIQRSGSKKRLRELNFIVEDTTKSYDERSAALEESSRIESNLLKRTINLGNQKLANMLGELELTEKGRQTLESFRNGALSAEEAISSLGISQSTLEDLENFRDVYAEIQNNEAELWEITTTRNNKQNALNKEENTKHQEAIQERMKLEKEAARKREEAYGRILEAQQKAIDKSKTELDIYYQTNVGIANSLQQRIELEEAARNKRLELLKEETQLQIKQAKGDTAEIAKIKAEAKAEELNINREFLQAQAELTATFAQQELDIWLAQNKSRLEDANRLNDDLVNAEQSRLETIYQKKLENIETEKKLLEEAGQFDYAKKLEYDQAKIDAETEYQDAKREVEKTYNEQKLEDEKVKRAEEFEARLISLEEENATEFEMRQELALQNYENELASLEEQREQGKINEENYQLALSNIQRQYANTNKQIAEEETKAKIALKISQLNTVANLIGKETAVGKAAAIASVVFEQGQALSGIIANISKANAKAIAASPLTAGMPWVALNTAKGVVEGGLVVAQAAKSISQINSAGRKTAAKGITLSGKSHASGGIDLFDAYGNHVVEAEGDENIYVLNKRASKEIAALSGWNQAFGGISLSKNVTHAANGGMIGYKMAKSGTTQQNIDVKAITDAVKQGAKEGTFQGSSAGSFEGSKNGTYSGSLNGIQEKRINQQIAASANHG